ncbi:hypothetical protein L9F63_011659, partial [Diploptera punctata]
STKIIIVFFELFGDTMMMFLVRCISFCFGNSSIKMTLNMQQQITITAWTITYANALQPSTVGKWRKRLLEMGRMHLGLALARMPKQRRELWRRSTLAAPTKLHVSFISVNRDVIEEEIRAVLLNMYHNAMNDFPKRCQLCLDVNGEHYQNQKYRINVPV